MNLGNRHRHRVFSPVAVWVVSYQEAEQAELALEDIYLEKDLQIHHVCQELHSEAEVWEYTPALAWVQRNQKLSVKRCEFESQKLEVEFEFQRTHYVLHVVMARHLDVKSWIKNKALPIGFDIIKRHLVAYRKIRLDLYSEPNSLSQYFSSEFIIVA